MNSNLKNKKIMFKVLLICFSFITFLLARDNPFFPVDTNSEPMHQKENLNDIIILDSEEETALSTEDEHDTNQDEQAQEPIKEKIVKPQIINYQQIRFVVSEKLIRIETKDALLRDFSIKKPTRVVLDYRSKNGYPTRSKKLEPAPFSELRIGSHKGYYRVVIELKQPMKYTIVPFRYGYNLTLQQ